MAKAVASTRRVRYSVAMSLDGYIAGPKGEYDWIVMDPEIDFGALMRSFDTMLMGRKTYEAAKQRRGGGGDAGMKSFVFSRTLSPREHPDVTVVSDNAGDVVRALKQQAGKDIWLFGGGSLFSSLLEARVVDAIEVAVVPVVLGGGRPLLPDGRRTKLRLTSNRTYQKSGIVALEYAVK